MKNRCVIATSDSEALIFQGAVTNPNALEQIQSPTYNLGIDQPTVAPTIEVLSALSSLEFPYYGVAGNSYIAVPTTNTPLKDLAAGVTLTLNVYDTTTNLPAVDLTVVTDTGIASGVTYCSDPTGYNTGPFPIPSAVLLYYNDWQNNSSVVYIRGTDWTSKHVIGARISWSVAKQHNTYDQDGGVNTNVTVARYERVILSCTYDGVDTKLVVDDNLFGKPGNAIDPLTGDPYEWEFTLSGTYIPLAAGASVPIPANRASFIPVPPEEGIKEVVVPLTAVVSPVDLAAGKHTWSANTVGYAYAWYDPVTGHISNISPIS